MAFAGRRVSAGDHLAQVERLRPVALALVEQYAVNAPEAIKSEAIVRFVGASLESNFGAKFTSQVRPLNHSVRCSVPQRGSGPCSIPVASETASGEPADMGWLTKVFGKPETRSTTSYTDLALLAAVQSAEGTSLTSETCGTLPRWRPVVSSLREAVFSGGRGQGSTLAQERTLSSLVAGSGRARHASRSGEHLDVIEPAPGGVELVPVCRLDHSRRAASIESWSYLCTLDGPSRHDDAAG